MLDPGAEIDVVASGTLIALSGQALGAPAPGTAEINLV